MEDKQQDSQENYQEEEQNQQVDSNEQEEQQNIENQEQDQEQEQEYEQEDQDQEQQQQNQDNNENDNEQELQQQQNEDQQHQNQDEEEVEINEVDLRSVYIQNVDYQSTKDDIIEHFKDVGEIHRVTILMDKYTGQPKGGAYIEFANQESVDLAKGLSDSMLRGRQIKVVDKRTNIRGFNAKRGRGRGVRRPAMGYHPMYMRGNYMFSYRGRGKGRGYRGPF